MMQIKPQQHEHQTEHTTNRQHEHQTERTANSRRAVDAHQTSTRAERMRSQLQQTVPRTRRNYEHMNRLHEHQTDRLRNGTPIWCRRSRPSWPGLLQQQLHTTNRQHYTDPKGAKPSATGSTASAEGSTHQTKQQTEHMTNRPYSSAAG